MLMPAGKPRVVRTTQQSLQKGDIIGVCLDLSIPQISFTVNGIIVKGFFRDFNVDGMFFPVISLSAKARSARRPFRFGSLILNFSISCSCFLAVLDPRVGHTMDVLSPFIPVLCHSD